MYIGYVDESGFVGEKRDPNQPVQVMACVLASDHNLGPTLGEYAQIMETVRKYISLRELKAQQVYGGTGPWKNVKEGIRYDVLETYINMLAGRHHRLVLSVVDNGAFFEQQQAGDDVAIRFGSPYVAGAMQLACAVQRIVSPNTGRKDRALLIFDEQRPFQARVQQLVAAPPECLRPLYGGKPGQPLLAQVIDTAYFVGSQYSPLIQTADIVAFVTRLHLQLTHYNMAKPADEGSQRIEHWFQRIKKRAAQSIAYTYPSPRGDRTEICEFYQRIAPPAVPKCFRL